MYSTEEILAFHDLYLRREAFGRKFFNMIEENSDEILGAIINAAIKGNHKCLMFVMAFATTHGRKYDEEIDHMRARLFFNESQATRALPKPVIEMNTAELLEEVRGIIKKFDYDE